MPLHCVKALTRPRGFVGLSEPSLLVDGINTKGLYNNNYVIM